MKLSVRSAIDALKPFSRLFIERPRFAAVISIVLALSGTVALLKLPVAQYPAVTPPRITVSCNYPGANAAEVMNTIAGPLEDEMNGVEDMLFMASSCADNGSYSLGITFEVGTDRDIALMKVQNRVQQALTKLPAEVKSTGLRVRCASEDQLGILTLRSKTGKLTRVEVSDYMYGVVQPALLRVPGVGDASIHGPKMAVRVWLDPKRCAAQGINSEEIVAAIKAQNVQASLGTVGASPAGDDSCAMTLIAKGRLKTPEEFADIIVRRDERGGIVRLKDVARTELGEQGYNYFNTWNNHVSISVVLNQMPGGNAIRTMNLVREKMHELEKRFPSDLEWLIPYDTTDYVRACLKEIELTLFITIFLVALVCWIFLQDWRATLVPVITIPVALLSTFLVMAALDYSVNIMTLFGLVLAIGTVVDDAIVVVERVQFLMVKMGYNAKEAAIQAMQDVTSPVIATTLVLLGIFVPVGFLGGIMGKIYQQFSVTLSAAVVFSSVAALTLSPALCTVLMKPVQKELRKFFLFRIFDRVLDTSRMGYLVLSSALTRRLALVCVLFICCVVAALALAKSLPTAFIPHEDQGTVMVDGNLPEGCVRTLTAKAAGEAVERVLGIEGVESVLTTVGSSRIGGAGENQTMMTVRLKPWEERPGEALEVQAIRARIQETNATLPALVSRAFAPPPIPGFGAVGGVEPAIFSVGDSDPERLARVAKMMGEAFTESPLITSAVFGYNCDTPHLYLDVDRAKCELYRVPLAKLYATLQNYLGSLYVNDVNLGTQVNRVTVQAEWEGRADADAVRKLYVRSDSGAMVPVGSLVTCREKLGPRAIYRRNQYVYCSILCTPAPGVPSGAVIEEVERIIAEKLPPDYGYDWTGLTFHELRSRGTAAPLLALAILFGYLFLVAQYESWTVPISVMLSVVTAVLGALVGLHVAGLPLSVYAQLGIILLVGLSAKNAILVVEFAKEEHERGLPLLAAAAAGMLERFRAVMMTALTFVLGIFPLVVATGAGAGSRRAIGVATFSGMLAATIVGILLVPALYVLFQSMRERVSRFFRRHSNG